MESVSEGTETVIDILEILDSVSKRHRKIWYLVREGPEIRMKVIQERAKQLLILRHIGFCKESYRNNNTLWNSDGMHIHTDI